MMHRSAREGKRPDARIDLREQPFNGREVGPIGRVQLPVENITVLHGIVLDVDPPIFRSAPLTAGAQKGPRAFYRETVSKWLGRHRVLRQAEVRSTGRGLHIIIWFAEPLAFDSRGERDRWDGIVLMVQAALPVDPDQPGLTALTRPVGSLNGKTGRPVKTLKPGTPIPVADVLKLYEQMVRTPFRTVAGILFGADRITPCPVCGTEGSSLSVLDYAGRCYGSCGNVKIDQLYDVFLAPRARKSKGGAHGTR
jgi:hypothetical protein